TKTTTIANINVIYSIYSTDGVFGLGLIIHPIGGDFTSEDVIDRIGGDLKPGGIIISFIDSDLKLGGVIISFIGGDLNLGDRIDTTGDHTSECVIGFISAGDIIIIDGDLEY
ncbi:unnamed protein product, partial [Rotaria sordida]